MTTTRERRIQNDFEFPGKRLQLIVRAGMYTAAKLAPGRFLKYRRNLGQGSWLANDRTAKPEWVKDLGPADDVPGQEGISFAKAYELARASFGQPDEKADQAGAPQDVDAALLTYEGELEVEGGNTYNARHPRQHLTPALLKTQVQMLTNLGLKDWRNGLIRAGMNKQTFNRMVVGLVRACNLAAKHDSRIKNKDAWADLKFAGTSVARNSVVATEKVLAFIAAAYERNKKFGVFCEVLGETGARASQVERLQVKDLRNDPREPKLMMPKSCKGGKKPSSRQAKGEQRYAVAISVELAALLQELKAGKKANDLLLTRDNGTEWSYNAYRPLAIETLDQLGMREDAEGVLMFMRHSSIVRRLLAGDPAYVVAALHDTSEAKIKSNYGFFITDHSDHISRRGLLPRAEATNVVQLRA
jgi:hypothetical protein